LIHKWIKIINTPLVPLLLVILWIKLINKKYLRFKYLKINLINKIINKRTTYKFNCNFNTYKIPNDWWVESKINGESERESEEREGGVPDKDETKRKESENRFYCVFEVHDNSMHLCHPMVKIETEILKK
jgi:hypothetical protein